MIKSLTISGFRGVREDLTLSLGQITLLAGRNGLGKTTVFDAIDWCLFGRSWRLGSDGDAIRNLYAPQLDPRVEMDLLLSDQIVRVERNTNGVVLDGERKSDRGLIEELMTDPGVIAPYARDPSRQIRQIFYLSQDELRAFVHPEEPEERTAIFRALLGVPNAAQMQSGVRRIFQQMRQREQAVQTKIRELIESVAKWEREIEAARIEGACGEGILSEAAEWLGAKESLSTDEAARRCRRALDELAVRVIQLDEYVGAIAAFRERRKSDSSLAEELADRLRTLELHKKESEAALSRAMSALTDAKGLEIAVRRDQVERRQQRDKLVAQIGIRAQIESLVSQEKAVAATLGTTEDRAASAGKAVQAAAEKLKRIRDESGWLLTNLEEVQARREHGLLRQQRKFRIMDLEQRLQVLSAELVSVQEARQVALDEAESARKQIGNLEAERREALAAGSREERLRTLLRELSEVISVKTEACPLCATTFGSHEELMEHVQTATSRHSASQFNVEVNLNALETARTHGERASTAATVAHERELSIRSESTRLEETLARERELIRESTNSGDVPSADKVTAARSAVEAASREEARLREQLRQEEERVRQIEADRVTAVARAASIRGELAEAKQKLDEGGDSKEQELESITLRLGDLERNAAEAVRELAAAQSSAQELESRGKEIARSIEVLRAEATEVEQRQAAELASLLSRVGAAGTDETLDQIAQRVNDNRQEARQRQEEGKYLWSALVAASLQEKANVLREQLKTARQRLSSSEHVLGSVRAARDRFELVVARLEGAAQREAESALSAQKEAIQKCYSALYPHGHLNEVVVGSSGPGTIGVTDRRLEREVLPGAFLSTGQANVLALSIFAGLASRQRLFKVRTLCLDDPVQHLDDLHFLRFVGLLKRIGLTRQVLLSTADENVAEIVTRQMNSSWARNSSDFARYDWLSFDPNEGPEVVSHTRARAAA